MAYELLLESKKLNKQGVLIRERKGLENFVKKIGVGRGRGGGERFLGT